MTTALQFNPNHDELGRFAPSTFEELKAGRERPGRELTTEEINALHTYIGGSLGPKMAHRVINGALRKDEWEGAPHVEQLVHTMDGAFDASAPLVKPITVYRGTADIDFQVGEEFIDRGFVSTSQSKQLAKTMFATTHAGKVLATIHVPKGARVLNLGGRLRGRIHGDAAQAIGSEEEILLPRGSRFRVLKYTPSTGSHGSGRSLPRWKSGTIELELVA